MLLLTVSVNFIFACPASDMALAWYLYQKQTTISGHGFPQIKILLLELRIKATFVGTTTFLTAENASLYIGNPCYKFIFLWVPSNIFICNFASYPYLILVTLFHEHIPNNESSSHIHHICFGLRFHLRMYRNWLLDCQIRPPRRALRTVSFSFSSLAQWPVEKQNTKIAWKP